MLREIWKPVAWVTLTVAAASTHSSQPTATTCSVADLDGDCDVDLADYSVFQAEFSSQTSFNLVGEYWDVFYQRNADQHWQYISVTLRFYANGTVDVYANGGGAAYFRFYVFDGQTVTIDEYSPGNDAPIGCPSQRDLRTSLTFTDADRMEGTEYCLSSGQTLESYLVLRRF